MSLVSNQAQISFASQFPVDKIVGVWEGTYNRATDVTTRTYTYLGSPLNVYVYRIPHGLTRPVFCDILWSKDGVTYADTGSTSSNGVALAYSDSTYIYIYDSQGVAASGTAHYKVIAFWIDKYDDTDPFVPSYLSPNKTTNFDSRLNYQKIYLQDVLTATNASGSVSTVIPTPIFHGLGTLPNHRVYFEAFTGEVWPAVAGGNSNLFLFSDNEAECQPYVDTSLLNLLVTLPAHSSARVWYRIYLDAA